MDAHICEASGRSRQFLGASAGPIGLASWILQPSDYDHARVSHASWPMQWCVCVDSTEWSGFG